MPLSTPPWPASTMIRRRPPRLTGAGGSRLSSGLEEAALVRRGALGASAFDLASVRRDAGDTSTGDVLNTTSWRVSASHRVLGTIDGKTSVISCSGTNR